eukprot:3311646-Amphidinium_carterae.1
MTALSFCRNECFNACRSSFERRLWDWTVQSMKTCTDNPITLLTEPMGLWDLLNWQHSFDGMISQNSLLHSPVLFPNAVEEPQASVSVWRLHHGQAAAAPLGAGLLSKSSHVGVHAYRGLRM